MLRAPGDWSAVRAGPLYPECRYARPRLDGLAAKETLFVVANEQAPLVRDPIVILAEMLYTGMVKTMLLPAAVAYVRDPVPWRSVGSSPGTGLPELPVPSSLTNCTHAHGATSAVSPTKGRTPWVTVSTWRSSTRARAMFRVSGMPSEPKNEFRFRSLTRTSIQ